MKFFAVLFTLIIASIGLSQGKLKPGDRVRISALGCPEVCGVFTVGADGLIHVPTLRPVSAGTLSLNDLKLALTSAGFAAGRDLRGLTIVVAEPQSRSVTVSGAVRRPIDVPWVEGQTLRDVIESAGPIDRADSDVVVVRRSSLGLEAMEIESTRLVLPGDEIYVPLAAKPPTVILVGAVVSPGTLPFQTGMTVSSAIKAAGGLSGFADLTAIALERDGKLFDTINLALGYDAPLRRGDVIRVSADAKAPSIQILGSLPKAGRLPWAEGMTLKAGLILAGWDDRTMKLESVVIARVEAGKRVTIKLSSSTPGLDLTPIKPSDVIEVKFVRQ